jgi:hypothetical protein
VLEHKRGALSNKSRRYRIVDVIMASRKEPLEDLPIDVRIILKWTRKWDGGMGWIGLAQDSDRKSDNEHSVSMKSGKMTS